MSVDRGAAMEMMRRTGQMGVPVIADEEEAIVGFDVPRLQRMAARHRRAPGLGLRVTDAPDGPVRTSAGFAKTRRANALVCRSATSWSNCSGRPVSSVSDLEQIAARRVPDQPTSLMVLRNGERKTLIVK